MKNNPFKFKSLKLSLFNSMNRQLKKKNLRHKSSRLLLSSSTNLLNLKLSKSSLSNSTNLNKKNNKLNNNKKDKKPQMPLKEKEDNILKAAEETESQENTRKEAVNINTTIIISIIITNTKMVRREVLEDPVLTDLLVKKDNNKTMTDGTLFARDLLPMKVDTDLALTTITEVSTRKTIPILLVEKAIEDPTTLNTRDLTILNTRDLTTRKETTTTMHPESMSARKRHLPLKLLNKSEERVIT